MQTARLQHHLPAQRDLGSSHLISEALESPEDQMRQGGVGLQSSLEAKREALHFISVLTKLRNRSPPARVRPVQTPGRGRPLESAWVFLLLWT